MGSSKSQKQNYNIRQINAFNNTPRCNKSTRNYKFPTICITLNGLKHFACHQLTSYCPVQVEIKLNTKTRLHSISTLLKILPISEEKKLMPFEDDWIVFLRRGNEMGLQFLQFSCPPCDWPFVSTKPAVRLQWLMLVLSIGSNWSCHNYAKLIFHRRQTLTCHHSPILFGDLTFDVMLHHHHQWSRMEFTRQTWKED